MLQIYTDGSCFPNPNGCGGWAFVATRNGSVVHSESGADKNTTNNRMELSAILNALEWINEDNAVIYSDSQYSVNAINDWFLGWIKKGKVDKMANTDLIKDCYKLRSYKNVTIKWIKGHSTSEFNNMADEMCNKEMTDLYKEVNGVEICMSDINKIFSQKRKQKSVTRKDKKTNLEKRMDKEEEKKAKLQAINNIKTKLEVITTNVNKPNYITINGIKYKKVR